MPNLLNISSIKSLATFYSTSPSYYILGGSLTGLGSCFTSVVKDGISTAYTLMNDSCLPIYYDYRVFYTLIGVYSCLIDASILNSAVFSYLNSAWLLDT